MDRIRIFKIGGNVLNHHGPTAAFLEKFATLEGPKILVHGGGREASQLMRRLGLEPKMIDGRRVTDADALQVTVMVYAGLVNKRLVASLQGLGCNAMGLCGADGSAIVASRRPAEPVDFGFVGDVVPSGVNAGLLVKLIGDGVVPVMNAITYDGHGGLLNTNADSVACAVASALAAAFHVELIYCFEHKGVLRDVAFPDSVVDTLTPALYEKLKENGKIASGMLPKLDGAFSALKAGVERVTIKHSDDILAASGTAVTL